MHEPPRAQHLEELGAEISRDRLHQTQRPLDRVAGVTDLAQMREDGLEGHPDPV